MPAKSLPVVDVIFDDPAWAKSRLGCRKLVPDMIGLAWSMVPERPKGFIPEVSVTLANDAGIHVLNKDHRGKDKPTNVLSFHTWDHMNDIPDGIGSAPVGDIIIAFETIKREAKEQGKPLSHHFCHMIIHGFLHLLGYDHIRDHEAETMEALEIKILAKAGIPNPYNL